MARKRRGNPDRTTNIAVALGVGTGVYFLVRTLQKGGYLGDNGEGYAVKPQPRPPKPVPVIVPTIVGPTIAPATQEQVYRLVDTVAKGLLPRLPERTRIKHEFPVYEPGQLDITGKPAVSKEYRKRELEVTAKAAEGTSEAKKPEDDEEYKEEMKNARMSMQMDLLNVFDMMKVLSEATLMGEDKLRKLEAKKKYHSHTDRSVIEAEDEILGAKLGLARINLDAHERHARAYGDTQRIIDGMAEEVVERFGEEAGKKTKSELTREREGLIARMTLFAKPDVEGAREQVRRIEKDIEDHQWLVNPGWAAEQAERKRIAEEESRITREEAKLMSNPLFLPPRYVPPEKRPKPQEPGGVRLKPGLWVL